MTKIQLTGVDQDRLAAALAAGLDDGGNEIEPFVDVDGGWTLRCCLQDSKPGDRIAIIAWSPFSWTGPYAETGPIVVHAEGCSGQSAIERLPDPLDKRAMTLRPYGAGRRIAYDRVRHVAAGDSLTDQVREMLEDPDIEFVHGRNVTGGCYSFQAGRSTRTT